MITKSIIDIFQFSINKLIFMECLLGIVLHSVKLFNINNRYVYLLMRRVCGHYCKSHFYFPWYSKQPSIFFLKNMRHGSKHVNILKHRQTHNMKIKTPLLSLGNQHLMLVSDRNLTSPISISL